MTVARATGSPVAIEVARVPNSGKLSREIASTNTSTIPPQVSPTVKASLSETPYRFLGARGSRVGVHGAFHAAAGHGPDGGAVRSDQHGRT